ncbi:sensor histidine kinase [Hoeflea sp.]|uniref:sensor histidine kinase n=1 Tax=Hoeflea sp. TaxID=1940281 RepID=UPI003B52CCAF
MKPLRSLRLRLIAFAAIVIAAALIVTGFSLSALFSGHLERRIGQELDTHLNQLVGGLRIDANGVSLVREPVDPRFAAVFGGLYWQVNDLTAGTTLRSRSLWDTYLEVPGDVLSPGETHVHDVEGPQGATLLTHETLIVLSAPDGDHRLRVAVAIDRADINALAAGFSRDLAPVLGLLGLVLMVGFLFQIREGLKPVHRVVAGVNAIRTGREKRLEQGRAPMEIAPLVDEVNSLLDAQDAAIRRARDRAANLAHGLKTPLTALESDIERLRERGETGIADEISDVAVRMRRHTDRELARARLRHGRTTARVPLEPNVAAILRTLKRTPAGEALDLECDIDASITVPIDIDDLNELIGNLAENAVRHANTRVQVSAATEADAVIIRIGDDGPGFSSAPKSELGGPRKREDESGHGTGLGLAIAGDILESVNGRLELDQSSLGGLEARMTVPLHPRYLGPG